MQVYQIQRRVGEKAEEGKKLTFKQFSLKKYQPAHAPVAGVLTLLTALACTDLKHRCKTSKSIVRN